MTSISIGYSSILKASLKALAYNDPRSRRHLAREKLQSRDIGTDHEKLVREVQIIILRETKQTNACWS
ncbi:hypothetical protein CY34DRAFT_803822 [Suillus luteus UH-Slu-Lm8-n1]|uniref:Uncharacterized protein n=1 Tax=Suillus luteus UH-Slu-Lm8-n1 TaxID=930992 RepID=A0A0D0ANV9_9AGAM|nr:hypothetical protein CY34DRAFT_803822 [Suillus luteus UH-Slu-Lm8-n1]